MENIRIALKICYNGTSYCGWQKQKDQASIQAEIEAVLRHIFRSKVTVHGAGRTDSGVHALGQVAHFDNSTNIKIEDIFSALNGLLPSNIRVTAISSVDNDFHARYYSLSKKYIYILNTNIISSPFLDPFTTHFPYKIDLSILKEGLSLFEGEHNFACFTTPDIVVKSTFRTILDTSLGEYNSFIKISIRGDGFLRYMVRSMIGLLLKLCQKKIDFDDISKCLSGQQIQPMPITLKVFPNGLYLSDVYYKEDPFKNGISNTDGIDFIDMLFKGMKI